MARLRRMDRAGRDYFFGARS